MFTDLYWIPWCSRIFQRDGQWRLSRAFSKSMNTTYKVLFHSCDCSRIWRMTTMWSMHDIPFLKPACCWHSILSSAVVMQWRMTWLKTLLVMDSSVMPLQLLHSDRFPFVGSLSYLSSKRRVSLHCPKHLRGCVEEAVAFPVLLPSVSLHTHCRPLVHHRSSASGQ